MSTHSIALTSKACHRYFDIMVPDSDVEETLDMSRIQLGSVRCERLKSLRYLFIDEAFMLRFDQPERHKNDPAYTNI